MLEQFHGYFQEIELPEPIIGRAEQLCEIFAQAIPGPPKRVFVSDFFDGEGTRRYSSLWLITGKCLIEVKNFVVALQADFTPLTGVSYAEFTLSDMVPFDGPVTRETTLGVHIQCANGLHAIFTATGNNCRHLYDLALTHLMPG